MHSVASHQAGVAFEAMLLEEFFKPLEKDFDAVGSYGIALLAQTIAQRDARGFGALLATRLNDRVR